MKFLHTIAEVLLYLMHKKWSTYMYLESDTTSGNFNVRITKCIVTRRPLQFTRCTEIRFFGTASENQSLLLLPVIQFCVVHFKTMPYTKSHIAFSAVHCSAFHYSSPCLALASLCTRNMSAEKFPPPSHVSLESYIKMVSPYKSASWTASLTLHLNFSTSTSEQSFGDFS